MVLYLLPFALYPIKDIYARNKGDILEWLDFFDKEKIEVLAQNGKNKPGGIEDMVQVEKGELLFDFGGIVSGNEFAYVDFTADFTAKIRLESVPSFPFYKTRLQEQKVGNLYVVKTCNGSYMSSCYVPQEVFEALKQVDISAHEERAQKHIEELNSVLSKNEYFEVPPKPTKYGDIN